MQKQLQQVLEFHKKFERPYSEDIEPLFDEKLIKLRQRLMTEECKEYCEAIGNEYFPIEDRAKEAADLLYVVLGTIITEGLQNYIEQAFDAVHISNMTKIGEDGKPVTSANGKILKGPNYQEADMSFLTKLYCDRCDNLKTKCQCLPIEVEK